MIPGGFATEQEAVAFLCGFFAEQGVTFRREVQTGSGRIDFLITDGNRAVLGIEAKRCLNHQSKIADFTDPFEQAAAYAQALRVPVLLAPILVDDASQSNLGHGGQNIEAYKTISIFAGRVNVGGLFFDRRGRWAMMLRGIAFWSSRGQNSADAMRFVDSTNSKKIRTGT